MTSYFPQYKNKHSHVYSCQRKIQWGSWVELLENVVDLAAKHALEKSINRRMAVPYSDVKVLTNVYVKKLWQTEWERYPGNKLYKIQPKVDDPIPSHGRCRREETIVYRLHSYWSHFLNSFLSFER